MKLPLLLLASLLFAGSAPTQTPPPLTQTQPPLTSDSSKARLLPPNPGTTLARAAQYMPPFDDIVVVFHTNERPLVVEVTIASNVVRRTRWWNNGVPATNDLVLSSNVVSRITNVVGVQWP